ncbi:hypothetical protein KL907_004345 [Ogataea polymorpha]|nr:hypothetical protein KL936_000194 [Ogataea polymorpha]KAG7901675.1 hypothetical protein KL907_004345 [Ogataea polymorpha]KAG7931242.1 hypothetical protein KL934_004363 [Ogataea polymorpha]
MCVHVVLLKIPRIRTPEMRPESGHLTGADCQWLPLCAMSGVHATGQMDRLTTRACDATPWAVRSPYLSAWTFYPIRENVSFASLARFVYVLHGSRVTSHAPPRAWPKHPCTRNFEITP